MIIILIICIVLFMKDGSNMDTSRIIFVIDFDSTFIKSETFDLLGHFSLSDQPDAEDKLNKIHHITDEAMEGNMDFSESLSSRISLLNASKDHFEPLIEKIRGDISPSFSRNRQFFINYSDQIYIISNGFREIIVPVVRDFGIPEKNVFAKGVRSYFRFYNISFCCACVCPDGRKDTFFS